MTVKLRRRKLKSGRTSLYLDIYHEGKRHYEYLKLYLGKNRQENKETLRLAESIRAKRQLELQSKPHGFTPAFKSKTCFVAYFKKLASTKSKSDTAWRNTVNKLEDFTGGSVRLDAVDEVWLEGFKALLLSELANTTARTYFAKVRAALRKASRDRLIQDNPAERVDHIPKQETERTFLTIEELRQMVKHIEASNNPNFDTRRAFLFSCYTGLRVSDVRSMRWSMVKNGRLHFRQQKTNGQEYLPLSPQAVSLLGEPGEPDAPVFRLPATSTVNEDLRRWAKAAGIAKHLTFHVSRHTFATLALTNDVDLYTVSKLLGHSDVHTTQVYAKVIDKKKQEAVSRLPSIER